MVQTRLDDLISERDEARAALTACQEELAREREVVRVWQAKTEAAEAARIKVEAELAGLRSRVLSSDREQLVDALRVAQPYVKTQEDAAKVEAALSSEATKGEK